MKAAAIYLGPLNQIVNLQKDRHPSAPADSDQPLTKTPPISLLFNSVLSPPNHIARGRCPSAKGSIRITVKVEIMYREARTKGRHLLFNPLPRKNHIWT